MYLSYVFDAIASEHNNMQPATIGPVIAIVVRKQKEVVAAFRRERATSAIKAVPLASLGIGSGNTFKHLQRLDVIRSNGAGLFYLDEVSWEVFWKERRRLALIASLAAIVVVLLALLLASA
jgi:hypothetical protein